MFFFSFLKCSMLTRMTSIYTGKKKNTYKWNMVIKIAQKTQYFSSNTLFIEARNQLLCSFLYGSFYNHNSNPLMIQYLLLMHL